MFHFKIKYFLLTIFLFVIELLIGMYVHDSIIRPYIGDLLVVILIYCFLKSFLNIPVRPLAAGVFVFACFIEMMQYFRLVKLLGLQDNKLARIIIGTSFSWTDILCYAIGILLVLFFEHNKA